MTTIVRHFGSLTVTRTTDGQMHLNRMNRHTSTSARSEELADLQPDELEDLAVALDYMLGAPPAHERAGHAAMRLAANLVSKLSHVLGVIPEEVRLDVILPQLQCLLVLESVGIEPDPSVYGLTSLTSQIRLRSR